MSKNRQNGTANGPEEKTIPDMVELWKNVYFQSEEAWGNAVNEFLATSTFKQMVNAMRNQYLAGYKVGNQNIEKILDTNVIPSKKDIAGLAELIIALEDKIDQIDYQIYGNMGKMTDSFTKMVEHQNTVKEELSSLKKSIESINSTLQATIKPDPKPAVMEEASVVKKKAKAKTTSGKMPGGDIS